jgi:hypothetical protein
LAESQALTELPPLPTQQGLICQGWNWSLDDIKAQNGPVIVGATYITDDGKTRIYITLHEGRTSPMLGVSPNGTVTVDWGDGTEPDVLTGTSTSTVVWTPNHEYASAGDYVISLSVDGEMRLSSDTSGSTSLLRYATSSGNRDYAYRNAITKAEIGANATIGNYAFAKCYALASVAIPNGMKTIGDSAFGSCYSLSSVVIPNDRNTITARVFSGCCTLFSVSIPNSVTSLGASTFNGCYSLPSVVIPNSVTNVGYETFYNCYSVSYYDFSSHTSVPTLTNTNAFTGRPADCQFLIPAALYDEWSAATNWTTLASYMVAV